RPGVGDRAPLPGRPAAYRLPPTTGTSAAPLRPPALPALVGTMPRRPPAARATERCASAAAGSGSGADAGGSRLQAVVRLGLPPTPLTPWWCSLLSVPRPLAVPLRLPSGSPHWPGTVALEVGSNRAPGRSAD